MMDRALTGGCCDVFTSSVVTGTSVTGFGLRVCGGRAMAVEDRGGTLDER